MGRFRRFVVIAPIALLFCIFCMAAPTAADASCALRAGWTQYAIYTFKDAQGKVTGIDAELAKAIATDIGCALTLVELPWARILTEIKDGTLDMTSSASRTPERGTFARFSAPYREAEVAIFVRKGGSDEYTLDALSSISNSDFELGVVVGYYYGAEFERLMKDPAFAAHVEGATDYPINIRKLLHDRIDGFLVDDIGVMVGEMKILGVTEQLERYPLRIAAESLHMMFSKKSVDPSIVEAVNASLAKMKADGRLKTIMDRFLN